MYNRIVNKNFCFVLEWYCKNLSKINGTQRSDIINVCG